MYQINKRNGLNRKFEAEIHGYKLDWKEPIEAVESKLSEDQEKALEEARKRRLKQLKEEHGRPNSKD